MVHQCLGEGLITHGYFWGENPPARGKHRVPKKGPYSQNGILNVIGNATMKKRLRSFDLAEGGRSRLLTQEVCKYPPGGKRFISSSATLCEKTL